MVHFLTGPKGTYDVHYSVKGHTKGIVTTEVDANSIILAAFRAGVLIGQSYEIDLDEMELDEAVQLHGIDSNKDE
jgi:hypothetical protein